MRNAWWNDVAHWPFCPSLDRCLASLGSWWLRSSPVTWLLLKKHPSKSSNRRNFRKVQGFDDASHLHDLLCICTKAAAPNSLSNSTVQVSKPIESGNGSFHLLWLTCLEHSGIFLSCIGLWHGPRARCTQSIFQEVAAPCTKCQEWFNVQKSKAIVVNFASWQSRVQRTHQTQLPPLLHMVDCIE